MILYFCLYFLIFVYISYFCLICVFVTVCVGGDSFELSTKQAEQIAKVFDTDNSGAVDYHEFVAFCEASDVREAVRMSKQVKKRKKRVSIASAK